MSRSSLPLLLAVVCLSICAGSYAEDGDSAMSDPLADFERIIGGQWRLEGSHQEFEWGVSRRSVVGRSYFDVDGATKLVSEGLWYWHPGEEKIRGVFTAVDMPVDLFDYTTRFEDDQMISELIAYAADGTRTTYVETWTFTDDSHFVWTLLRETADGLVKEMEGLYTRSD